ncbi:MAG: hypothetical protein COC05_02470 [Gammaproteobacteria bacterium]|nr:MAG: hypothetical protein COC05_02470 [Gammaproteobacteria bacterium]
MSFAVSKWLDIDVPQMAKDSVRRLCQPLGAGHASSAYHRNQAGLDSDVQSAMPFVTASAYNHHAVSHPELRGMGTTLVLVWLQAISLHCFHVGDSRDYCLAQLTADHVSTRPGKGSKPALGAGQARSK